MNHASYTLALNRAKNWHAFIAKNGFTDVDLIQPGTYDKESDFTFDPLMPGCVGGRWIFIFRQRITGVEVRLGIHGFDCEEPAMPKLKQLGRWMPTLPNSPRTRQEPPTT